MILLIDNFDSFSYNIAHALGVLGKQIKVLRPDGLGLEAIEALSPEAIVISPGPGRPDQAGLSCRIIERFSGQMPILGVCLGHQCIAQVFGAQVVKGERPVHGKVSQVFHDGRTVYQGLRNPFEAARYHSLIVPEETVPPSLEVSAYTQEGVVMGLRSRELMVEGLQFHPESVATPQGALVFKNFLGHYLNFRQVA
ncbi:MAG: aminodeoxychorismate/anthranilate synthase component II [Deltaproteobacteria bacterium]|nr:aminodeoxychorismate/anthranilate synthase component II [Deltaproteobacteria bacterium]